MEGRDERKLAEGDVVAGRAVPSFGHKPSFVHGLGLDKKLKFSAFRHCTAMENLG